MKKNIAFLLACILLLAGAPALSEDADNPSAGAWYADLNGVAVTLTLAPDGTYTLEAPALPELSRTGTWELLDGFVYMDGEENTILSYNGQTLTREDPDLRFSREPVKTYTPAELYAEIPLPEFGGAWQTSYVIRNGCALLTYDDMLIYIEETRALLKGGPFGYRIVDLTFENGALAFADDEIAVRLEMQQDGFLRLTVEREGLSEVRILDHTEIDELDTDDNE